MTKIILLISSLMFCATLFASETNCTPVTPETVTTNYQFQVKANVTAELVGNAAVVSSLPEHAGSWPDYKVTYTFQYKGKVISAKRESRYSVDGGSYSEWVEDASLLSGEKNPKATWLNGNETSNLGDWQTQRITNSLTWKVQTFTKEMSLKLFGMGISVSTELGSPLYWPAYDHNIGHIVSCEVKCNEDPSGTVSDTFSAPPFNVLMKKSWVP